MSVAVRRPNWRACAALAVAAAAFTGLASPASGQRVLTVVASDTALDAPLTVPAGIVTVQLVLKGKTRRDLVVHRVPASTTPESLVQAAAGRPERWFADGSFGGPATPRESTPDASVTMDLRPGRYALVSYETDETGRARPDKYIWREVVVAAASILIPARFPVPDASIRLRDKGLVMEGLLRAGQKIIEVENAGSSAHEVIIGRLLPGKTVADVERWDRERSGPPPFAYVGGITPMSPAVTTQTRLVLQSGMHVVFCPARPASERDHRHTTALVATFKVN